MISLIKKDALTHNWIVYLSITLMMVLMILFTLPAVFITIVCLFSLAFSLFSYDNMGKVNIYLKSMPIDNKQIVLSRYLFSIFTAGVILIFQACFQLLFTSTLDGFPFVYQVKDFYVFFMLCCFIIGIFYPIIYFFKYVYAAIGTIIVFIGIGTFYTIDLLVNEQNMTDEIIFNDLDKGIASIVERYLPFSPYLTLLIIIGIILYSSIICSIYLFKR